MLDLLLPDLVRAVRIETAATLAGMFVDGFSRSLSTDFDHATADYIAAWELHADRSEARIQPGPHFAREGRTPTRIFAAATVTGTCERSRKISVGVRFRSRSNSGLVDRDRIPRITVPNFLSPDRASIAVIR